MPQSPDGTVTIRDSEFLQKLILVDSRLPENVTDCIPTDYVVEGHDEKPLALGVRELPVAPPLGFHDPAESRERAEESPPVNLTGKACHSYVHRDDLDVDRWIRPGGSGLARLFAVP